MTFGSKMSLPYNNQSCYTLNNINNYVSSFLYSFSCNSSIISCVNVCFKIFCCSFLYICDIYCNVICIDTSSPASCTPEHYDILLQFNTFFFLYYYVIIP